MKTRWMIAVAVVAIALVGVSAFAQDAGEGGRRACNPEGTWFGSNAMGQNYIFTITSIDGGRFMIVADGLTDLAFCADASNWRGELVRTGRNRYQGRQILLCNSEGTLLLWAVEGEMAFSGCDHIDFLFDSIGAYLWGTEFTPFVDPFAIPFIPPGDPLPASYDRMPSP